MHPCCCWGNFLQSLVQFVPILAIFAIAYKKVFGAIAGMVKRTPAAVPVQPACCSDDSHCGSTEFVTIDKISHRS